MQIVQHSGGIPLGLLTIELDLISSSYSARNTLGAVTCHGRFFPYAGCIPSKYLLLILLL